MEVERLRNFVARFLISLSAHVILAFLIVSVWDIYSWSYLGPMSCGTELSSLGGYKKGMATDSPIFQNHYSRSQVMKENLHLLSELDQICQLSFEEEKSEVFPLNWNVPCVGNLFYVWIVRQPIKHKWETQVPQSHACSSIPPWDREPWELCTLRTFKVPGWQHELWDEGLRDIRDVLSLAV